MVGLGITNRPMIIQCPACTTRYVVPDTAIGVEGRTVRCAKCRHSWFQDGPVLERPQEDTAAPADAPAPPPSATQDVADVDAQDAGIADDDTSAVEVAPQPTPAPPSPVPPSPVVPDEIRAPQVSMADQDYQQTSHFDHEPPFRPRRNPLKLWTWAAAIFAIMVAGLIVAVSYWGLPDWVQVDQPTFAAGNPDLQLDFPRERQERRTLSNGTEFFGATGTITNVGTHTETIPSILIVLRDSRGRKVYDWVVPPPRRTLAPGEVVEVNEAVTDIPRSASEVQFGWKPE